MHLARVVQLLLDLVVANLAGGFLQLARGVARLPRNFAGSPIELVLESLDLLPQLIFPLAESLRFRRSLLAR